MVGRQGSFEKERSELSPGAERELYGYGVRSLRSWLRMREHSPWSSVTRPESSLSPVPGDFFVFFFVCCF